MSIESEKDLQGLRKAGKVVAYVRDAMLKMIHPGVTTEALDQLAERLLAVHGARSAPRKDYNFPGATCISVNNVVAHGIPGAYVIRAGDLVNVDVSAELDGYYADTGATVVVEPCSDLKSRLCECSKYTLDEGLKTVRAGRKISEIGRAMHRYAKKHGFTVIKNLAGHGTGRRLHEEPHNILNYFDPFNEETMTPGLVLAIESFVSSGAEFVVEGDDGWALQTPDRSFVAQFEHTVMVTQDGPVVMTA